jgi:hypothetical protein
LINAGPKRGPSGGSTTFSIETYRRRVALSQSNSTSWSSLNCVPEALSETTTPPGRPFTRVWRILKCPIWCASARQGLANASSVLSLGASLLTRNSDAVCEPPIFSVALWPSSAWAR